MLIRKVLSTKEAAQIKKCSRQAIVLAIKRGEFDAFMASGVWIVHNDKGFKQWKPNKQNQCNGKCRPMSA